jgi:hypothetical protein
MSEMLQTSIRKMVGRRLAYGVVDLIVVATFVLIGRDTHDESIGFSEVLRTGAPFLLALAGAWLTPLVHRMPWRLGAGLAAGAITAGAGIYFRAVIFGEGVSGAFPIVTAAYLIGLMAAARVVGRLTARGAAP